MAPNTEKQILSLEETLALLNWSQATLYRRIREGVISPLPRPVGLQRRARLEFNRAEIERYKRENS